MPQIQLDETIIHYDVVGHGAPLLLLHGSGVSLRMWTPQRDVFAQTYQVIMPDLRGHGGSGPLPPTNDYHALMADDLHHLLQRLGIQRAHVVGVSMGAVVAARLAIQYPQHVDHLVLAHGYSEMPTLGAAWLLRLSNAIFRRLSIDTILKLALQVYKPGVEGHDLTRAVLQQSFTRDKDLFFKLKDITFPAFTELLPLITARTLVIAGDRLKFEQKGAHTLYEQIPNAHLAIFANAFDPVSTMRKDIFNEMVLDFLADRPLKSYTNVAYSHIRRPKDGSTPLPSSR